MLYKWLEVIQLYQYNSENEWAREGILLKGYEIGGMKLLDENIGFSIELENRIAITLTKYMKVCSNWAHYVNEWLEDC